MSQKNSDTLSAEKVSKKFLVQSTPFQDPIYVHAVQEVSFEIEKGQTLGLVGESGCGKSTLGRCLLRLIEPSSGSFFYEGVDVFQCSKSELKSYRKQMQIVFQDPFSSLNPRMSIRSLIEEPLIIHRLIANRKEREERVAQLLDQVGLAKDMMLRYPHEFSGGQRQRIGIARALAVNPQFIVCDEPVSALDVSVQAQILNLLMDLQEQLSLSYLFISHDLKVVEHISQNVAVMYLGKIVERAPCDSLYQTPLHPYTKALLSSVPELKKEKRRERVFLKGELPLPTQPPSGCQFHPRCPIAEEHCAKEIPALKQAKEHPNHYVACHLVE